MSATTTRSLISAVIMALLLYRSIKTMRRGARPGMTKLFWQLLLALGAFVGLWVVPLAFSNLLETHQTLFFTLLFGGIAAFGVVILRFSKKTNKLLREPTETDVAEESPHPP